MMTPLQGRANALLSVAAGGPLVGARTELSPDSIGQHSRLLDSDQFAALGFGLALVIALLCVVAVGVWRR